MREGNFLTSSLTTYTGPNLQIAATNDTSTVAYASSYNFDGLQLSFSVAIIRLFFLIDACIMDLFRNYASCDDTLC